MSEAICRTCPFWSEHQNSDIEAGECRHGPPRLLVTGAGENQHWDPKDGIFPVTIAESWCGAHPQRRASSEKKPGALSAAADAMDRMYGVDDDDE